MKTIELLRDDFINQYPPLNLMNKNQLEKLKARRPSHLYIHIPYCLKKCDFCYYKSFETKQLQVPDEYVNALIKEIEMLDSDTVILRSMYWGGGTPTLLSCEQIEKIILAIKSRFVCSSDFEFCCEMRPGPETSEDKLQLLTQYGLKRASIGCQSLNSEVLRFNGRNHSTRSFMVTYEKIRKIGVDNINVDIMTGMIGDTAPQFMETVNRLVELKPENITIYKMQMYYNSTLYKKYHNSNIYWASDAEEAEMAKEAYQYILGSGYEFADNFSFRMNKKCEHIHRTGTWSGEDMIGVGLSSHSCVGNIIYQNENDLKEYFDRVNAGKKPISRAYEFSIYEAMIRHLIFGIKSCSYKLSSFNDRFGCNIEKIFMSEINYLKEQQWVVEKEDMLHATLQGALYSDDIVRLLFPKGQEKVKMGHRRR